MYCMPSYNVFFYFLIVRRPWPNFVCKGRHTSSVVLVLGTMGIDTKLFALGVPYPHFSGRKGKEFAVIYCEQRLYGD